MSIPGELERARHLAYADEEESARDLLVSLVPQIEAADSDLLLLEVFAQLGELLMVRTNYEATREFAKRIRDCLAVYATLLDGTATPEVQAQNVMSLPDIRHMDCRYSRRAQFLEIGLAAASGDHEGAAQRLASFEAPGFEDLEDEFAFFRTYARVLCATALCEDDLHVRSVSLWAEVTAEIGELTDGSETSDRLWVIGALGYARFCIETGRRAEAEPWLRRAGARASARGWDLMTARTQLERAASSWAAGERATVSDLITEAAPVMVRFNRANDVSRCWLYSGLTWLAAGHLETADECWEHAERHWREIERPLHIHRILLQRSWIAIFRGRYAEAIAMTEQARECLDSSPRSSWLAYARLDDHLGNVWRADALADLGFDGAGNPDEEWSDAYDRFRMSLGVTNADRGSPAHHRALTKFATAAELKVPAALAVDSVRYAITDAEARAQWATCVSAPMLASSFAVAWEAEDTELLSGLIEYHSARGTFNTTLPVDEGVEFARVATAVAPIADLDELALVASAPPAPATPSVTRLGPLPPLQMDPMSGPLLAEFRALALRRYGQVVTADEPVWSTWP